MVSDLARRLGGFEERLEALEAQRADEVHQTEFRVHVFEQRLLEVESAAPRIAQLQQTVDDLARLQAEGADAIQLAEAIQRAEVAAAIQRAEVAAAIQRAEAAAATREEVAPLLHELRAVLTESDRRQRELENRVTELESLPSAIEDPAVDQLQRLAEEVPVAAPEIEGVYRELDSVAEHLARRDAEVARGFDRFGLERLGPLEKTVDEVRDEVGRLASQLSSLAHADASTASWMGDVDTRMKTLESSTSMVERLRMSLDRVSEELAVPRATDDRTARG